MTPNRSASSQPARRAVRLSTPPLSVVALLLVYAFTRLHNLLAMPLFVDESLYIYRAQLVRGGQLLLPAQYSRTLHAWIFTILGPYPPGGGWVARYTIVLLALVSAAAVYALVRSLISHRAGLVALVLWIATPYLFFYERMGLADSALNATSVVAVLLAWKMIRTRQRWVAVALGISLAVVLLAKASGTTWLPLPLVALLIAGGLSWRRRLELGALAYGTFGALWGVFTLAMASRGHNYFGEASRFVGDANETIFERTWNHIGAVWGFDVAYIGLPVVILAIISAAIWLWHDPRRALVVILALGMGGGGAIVFGKSISSRYAYTHAGWVVLLCAAGIGLLIERYPRWRPAVAVALAAWIAVFFAPFALTAWNDPADLPLDDNDTGEYLAHESSGFAVTEIGEMLSSIDDPLPTLGFVSNCQALRVVAHPVDVTCPTLYWDVQNADRLMAQAEAWAQDGPLYVVGEQLAYLDLSALPVPHSVLATVARPGGTFPVALYRIEQGAQRPD